MQIEIAGCMEIINLTVTKSKIEKQSIRSKDRDIYSSIVLVISMNDDKIENFTITQINEMDKRYIFLLPEASS